MTAPPTVTVGIPTLLRESVLLDTLDCVLSQREPADEIIVADQTQEHEPQTAERLRELQACGRIRLIRLQQASLTAARNAILKASGCDYVIFVDDDVRCGPDFVANYRRAIADNASQLVAGGVDLETGKDASPRDCRAITHDEEVIDLVRGCNFAVERATALETGGFDERFIGPAHGEEQDLAFQLLRRKKKIAFDGTLRLLHRRTPIGGCRVVGHALWTNWQKPMNWLMFGFRYPAVSKRWWWLRVWAALRCGPLLRENFRMHRQLGAWSAMLYATKQAWIRRNRI